MVPWTLPHESLPPPFDKVASTLLLVDIRDAEYYLMVSMAVLTVLMFVQLRAFARPPPVPLKSLPKRPALSILFKPDDISSSNSTAKTTKATVSTTAEPTSQGSKHSPLRKGFGSMSVRSVAKIFRGSGNSNVVEEAPVDDIDDEDFPEVEDADEDLLDADDCDHTETTQTHFGHFADLPDSFAPLLSSSQTEVLWNQVTADLIHAVHAEASVRMREGRHEIPLDKDQSRPQLVLDIPKGGCRLSAVASIGSDGFTPSEDLDISKKTTSRSKPMVKRLGLVIDPPLPLSNVAPTLIHFPTLFEDRFVPKLRRIQIVRLALDFVVSISSFLERCLWILESKCQIHLSKVSITPLYKGRSSLEDKSPEWRLSLAFSGHVLLFNWIPIPFISVVLPTFIIPQPHALLENLLTSQPLASARLKRENIAEERIALAMIDAVESWSSDLKFVATPPALGVDVTLPGGIAIAMELVLGKDPHAGRSRAEAEVPQSAAPSTAKVDTYMGSGNSLSSWTTHMDSSASRQRRGARPARHQTIDLFDANQLVPWTLELSAKGSISHEKMSVHILKAAVSHEASQSEISTRGSFAVWKLRPSKDGSDSGPLRLERVHSSGHRRRNTSLNHPELDTMDSPSVSAILLFLDETESFHHDQRMLKYDFIFDVADTSRIDAVTLSIGASHTMLNGGTMVTTVLESIYAFGWLSAREDAVLDPLERRRKRNILRHIPSTNFTFGIQNVFIPPESESYSDDGQTLFKPELDGGRMMIRMVGGAEEPGNRSHSSVSETDTELVSDGIKLVADFEIASLVIQSSGAVKEFPELEIFEGVKLRTQMSGTTSGRINAHLRPQDLSAPISTTGPNVLNPLEAYEIDFSGCTISVKLREYMATLGHRRIIFPTMSTFLVKVIESVVDMGFEGKTECELTWDFQGLSPILQMTTPGQSPEDAVPENKEQVSLLIAPLRQGRLSFHVSSVGGINVDKAATSREDKEGLYDWKFFNAIVSPDGDSGQRLLDVVHDKRTMEKLLQVTKLLNKDLHAILRYGLRQIWRAKEILDKEGVEGPSDTIPMAKMSRLISLLLSDDDQQVQFVLPIVERVIAGDGLDIVKVKELLRRYLPQYDDWAPEIDRAIRWAAVAFGPMAAAQPYVEGDLMPLAEMPHHASKFRDIPSASQLYSSLHDRQHMPLDATFSTTVSRVAPYLTFQQIDFILRVRGSSDWQPADLRRIRYVYSIKRKVLEIAESYGGLSFLPQSFLVSIFLGEATRTSLRASGGRAAKRAGRAARSVDTRGSSRRKLGSSTRSLSSTSRRMRKPPTLSRLRQRPSVDQDTDLFPLRERPDSELDAIASPAGRVASTGDVLGDDMFIITRGSVGEDAGWNSVIEEGYELGDSLLGPQDVAILLQAGLTSVMKASTVVQLNQRMLLDLICSQPRTFAVAVLAEIGSPSGQGSPRSLTSALMALLELDQTAFIHDHQIDMHALLESWLPGLKVPRREDYLAGGRWARQSYYEAIFSIAKKILDDAEAYMALKGHLQRVRRNTEKSPLPKPREEIVSEQALHDSDDRSSRLVQAIEKAKAVIAQADETAKELLPLLVEDAESTKESDEYEVAVNLYKEAFDVCAKVLSLDKHAFHAPWFAAFYKRNYDALMIKSIYDNLVEDVDKVRTWLNALRQGSKEKAAATGSDRSDDLPDDAFLHPFQHSEQDLLDAIIDATIYEPVERDDLRRDPLVRLLIGNPPGRYNFAIVSAMGVITDGSRGLELEDAFCRLHKERDVKVIRADTGTARSFEYNASKIEEAIETATKIGRPFGLLGYSQGCANILMAESILLSGSPKQREMLTSAGGGLVCRQLLFSAANGSFHGPAMEKKVQRLIVMCEEFFKYQQGYFSRALSSSVLEYLNTVMDSPDFHKLMGGAQSFLPDGSRAFWREAQHLSHVPTCTLRGVMEKHTTPESLEMLSNLLTKQSGSALHDSQVHVFDAVGYPVYHSNRNGRLLKRCAVGEGAVQRTHHWSPLSEEVEFLRTPKDVKHASFDCAKDRHVFPWVDVNVRFGFIKYAPEETAGRGSLLMEFHPAKLVGGASDNRKKPAAPHQVALYAMNS